jgi:hypothetical protein
MSALRATTGPGFPQNTDYSRFSDTRLHQSQENGDVLQFFCSFEFSVS